MSFLTLVECVLTLGCLHQRRSAPCKGEYSMLFTLDAPSYAVKHYPCVHLIKECISIFHFSRLVFLQCKKCVRCECNRTLNVNLKCRPDVSTFLFCYNCPICRNWCTVQCTHIKFVGHLVCFPALAAAHHSYINHS